MATVDLNLLQAFVSVAQTSSFSAAARLLGQPKSSVSRGIARLEESLGMQLLHRTTRQVALSTAGVALLERIGPHLTSLSQAVCGLPELEETPSGRLRITASPDFGSAVLCEVLARFSIRYPNIEVDIRLTNQLVDLVEDGVDVALRFSPNKLKDSTLIAKRVWNLSSGLYASPSYLARHGTPRSLEDLADHQWVRFRGYEVLTLESGQEVSEVTPKGSWLCDDMAFCREAVRQGVGVALLPGFLAESDVTSGSLVRVLPRYQSKNGSLWILNPGGQIPKKVAAFRDFFLENVRKA